MKLGRVIGSIVSTLKSESFKGAKLLLVERIDLQGKRSAPPVVAIDRVDAGPEDLVLLIDEGNSVRQLLQDERVPARTLVIGVIDHFDLGEDFLSQLPGKAPRKVKKS